MMTHDPFQNYQTPGAYPGTVTPFGIPYTAFQSPFNPIAFTGQPQQHAGIGGYGFYTPQQHGGGYPGQHNPLQQLWAWNQLAALQNQMLQNSVPQNPALQNQLQNPLLQNPLLQNPLVASGLQNPLLNPALAYQGWPQQQQQFGYPLAPQTMIGAGGIGQPYAQINPLAQLAFRQATGYGFSPVAGSF